jgi:hypothetical protein
VRTLSLDLAQAEAAGTIVAQTQGLEIGLFVYNSGPSVIGPFKKRMNSRNMIVSLQPPLTIPTGAGYAGIFTISRLGWNIPGSIE